MLLNQSLKQELDTLWRQAMATSHEDEEITSPLLQAADWSRRTDSWEFCVGDWVQIIEHEELTEFFGVVGCITGILPGHETSSQEAHLQIRFSSTVSMELPANRVRHTLAFPESLSSLAY